MLLGGQKIAGPRIETLVIPVGNRRLVFKAKLVKDYEDFDKLCPRPLPATLMLPGGEKKADIKNPDYLAKLKEYSNRRTDWMILESLSATPDLKWETVEAAKPETWGNYHKELEEAGLSESEQVRIIQLVLAANGLDQDKIDSATHSFLAEEAERSAQSSPTGAGPSTQSGEPVNG